MKIYNDILQGSPEWFEKRKGKMTASEAQAIGNNGKGLETYIKGLMAEFYSSGEKEIYTNKDLERGKELEQYARDMYELENDCKVEQVGFIELNEFVGCSPDGLIGEDGGIEIKSVNDVNHFALILNGEKGIESKYVWQVQMNLLITGRKWWDYVSYNPNFEQSLIVFRILPDQEKHKKLLAGIELGIKQIKEIKNKINEVSNSKTIL